MKRHQKALTCLFLLACLAILASCAAKPPIQPSTPSPSATLPAEFTVFYDSDPPGAVFYENGTTKVGEIPFWASYPINEKHRGKGFIFIDPASVVWPSGAKADNFPGLIFPLGEKYEGRFTFVRPDNAPGKEDDYQYGLKRLLNRIEKGETPTSPEK